MQIIKLFFCLIIFVSFVNAKDRSNIEKVIANTEHYIQQTMPDWQAPAVAIVVVKDNKIIHINGFGTAKLGTNSPISKNTVFQIASMTKNFTAVLAGILAEKGFFSLDDKVIKYLPNFKLKDLEVTKNATIRDLLSHRIGLKAFSGDSAWNVGYSPEEMLEFLSNIDMVGEFGKTYAYQNIIFAVVGMVMEKATGRKYADLVDEFLAKPLGLNSLSARTDFLETDSFWSKIMQILGKKKIHPLITTPHDLDENEKVRVSGFNNIMNIFPATAGIRISLEDVAKWMLMHLNNGFFNNIQIVSPKHLQDMQTLHVNANFKNTDLQFPPDYFKDTFYGMGWFGCKYGLNERSINIFTHMGGYAGVRTLITIIPEENLGICILSNLGAMRVSLQPEALRNYFLDQYLKLPTIDWSKNILEKMQDMRKKNKEQLYKAKYIDITPMKNSSEYSGKYYNEGYKNVEISEDKGKITMLYRGKKIPLEHINGDMFSFNPSILSKAYSGVDLGYMVFFLENNEKKMYINLMSEVREGIFIKK
jgi:CubicO group peptidase (beta-lactamase class C family)